MTTGAPSRDVGHQAVGGAEIDADDLAHDAAASSRAQPRGATVGQQVGDVGPLEQQRRAARPAPRAGRSRRRRPRAGASSLRHMRACELLARARRASPRSARAGRAEAQRDLPPPARPSARMLADRVELLVQREHFLEQRRRHLASTPRATPSARSPSSFSRYSMRAIGSRSVRYASFRYDERSRLASRSVGRRVVEVVRVKLAAQRRGTAARDPPDRGSACAAGRGT